MLAVIRLYRLLGELVLLSLYFGKSSLGLGEMGQTAGHLLSSYLGKLISGSLLGKSKSGKGLFQRESSATNFFQMRVFPAWWRKWTTRDKDLGSWDQVTESSQRLPHDAWVDDHYVSEWSSDNGSVHGCEQSCDIYRSDSSIWRDLSCPHVSSNVTDGFDFVVTVRGQAQKAVFQAT